MNFSDVPEETTLPSESFRHFPNEKYTSLHQQLVAIANGDDETLETFLADIKPYLRKIHARLRNDLGMTHVIDDHDIHDIVTDSLLVTIDSIRRKRACDSWSTFATNFLTKVGQRTHIVVRRSKRKAALSLYDDVPAPTEIAHDDGADDEQLEVLPLHETIPSRPFSSDTETARISGLYDALIAKVDKLPERMRSVVRMRFGIGYEQQMSRDEIARILGFRSSEPVRMDEIKALQQLHMTLAAFHLLEVFDD
jgi:DNA-directed RNA polymerase specialized sigma24 family protein